MVLIKQNTTHILNPDQIEEVNDFTTMYFIRIFSLTLFL